MWLSMQQIKKRLYKLKMFQEKLKNLRACSLNLKKLKQLKKEINN